MLTSMLDESGALQNLTLPEKTILLKLAQNFQSNTNFLFLNHEELAEHTGIGTPDQWKNLLNMQETQNFIKGQMAFIAQIAQRKTFHALVSEALRGNAQAAKQVQELSGIMNQQDTNKTIILHQIPRPKNQQKGE